MNNQANLRIVIGVLLGIIIGALGVSFIGPMRLGTHGMSDGTRMSNQSLEMHSSMNMMMQGLAGKTGRAFDRAFIDEMIVHHEGAVEMAQAALVSAEREEIKTLSRAIISAQEKEIAEMKAWRSEWFGK